MKSMNAITLCVTLCTAISVCGAMTTLRLDTRSGTRQARAMEPLAYSTDWNAGATGVTIALDGETLFSAAAPTSGNYAWNAASAPAGLHTLTFGDGVETLNAQFAVGRGAFSVVCPYDGCDPAAGTNEYEWGSVVTASAPTYFVDGLERHACTGWTGTGSVPASGAGTNAVFTILEDSSLAWTWQTNYLVRISVVGDGTTDFSEGWVAHGSNLVVTATAGETAYASAVWSGDVVGAAIDGLSISIPVDGPKDVTITFTALDIGDAVEQPSLVCTTEGDSTWIPVADGALDGVDAAMAPVAGIGEYAESCLRTIVEGPGDLSFWWKVDVAATSGAGIDLYVDGLFSEDVWLSGPAGWTRATVSLGAGSHTMEWVFWSDGADPAAAGWLDKVSFLGGETATTPVPVPYDWLGGYGLGDGTATGYEAAANAIASNGVNKVWECYVAGLNPTNATDRFETRIEIDADGQLVISWEPDLNENGTKQERVYTVEGRESLSQGNWGPTNANSRFFHVKVEMP